MKITTLMNHYRIRHGYNIPIKGKAQASLEEADTPSYFSVRPTEFHYIKPKLQVAPGDSVHIGSPLFFDKRQPKVVFVSPVAGKVHHIHYGPRRVVERITIEASNGEEAKQWPSFRPGEIRSTNKDKIKELLLEAGMWPYIRQRPFDVIAKLNQPAGAIFINCMNTSPLSADPEFCLSNRLADFQAGVDALSVLCENVHVVLGPKAEASLFKNTKNAILHSFNGPHPAGLVGTHIHHIYPLHTDRVVWYLNARDVACIGNFLLVGQYPTERIFALAGEGAKQRKYFKTKAGANLSTLLKHNALLDSHRIISGDILTGKTITQEDSLGFYDDSITILPESKRQNFIGWMLPGLNCPSWSRAFVSSLFPWRNYDMNTNKNGELRAFVKTGDYEKVMALDVLPSFLVKAILVQDIELMEQLGIYETSPEDLALCSYICPSKIEFTKILRDGLDLMLAETS